jgi:hypothetical protein
VIAMKSMNTSASSRSRAGRTALSVSVATLLTGSALLAAGCGGGLSGTKVAQLETTTTGTTSSSSSSGESSSGQGSPVAFAACMRKHGVPLFPDSSGGGAISPGKGVDLDSPQFRRARDACRSLLPAGMDNTTAGRSRLSPQHQAQLLRYARCMRSHGLARFPDPTSRGLALEPDQVDTRSPQFQAANQACRSFLPKLAGGQTHTTGGGAK